MISLQNQTTKTMSEIPKKRGGRRDGAGRKSKTGEATTVKRIPVSLIPTVDAMIASSALPPDSLIPISRTNLKVPVALEKVPAGFPSPAEPYVADYLDFNEYLIANPSATQPPSGGCVLKLFAFGDVRHVAGGGVKTPPTPCGQRLWVG